MATYDVLGRLTVNDSSSESSTVRREDVEAAFTEKTVYTYVVPAGSTDLELSLGGLANADVLWLESQTNNEAWGFKLNADTNTAIDMGALGFMLLSGATVTSIFVTVQGTEDITLRVAAVD